MVFAPNAPTGKVLTDTELRAIFTNPDVTHINGTSKTEFLDSYRSKLGNPGYVFDDYKALDQSVVDDVFSEITNKLPDEYFDKVEIHYGRGGGGKLEILGIDTSSITGNNDFTPPKDSLISATLGEIADSLMIRTQRKDSIWVLMTWMRWTSLPQRKFAIILIRFRIAMVCIWQTM